MEEHSKQQTARVNVTGDDWIAFRHLAMKQHRSLADYLGALVRDELRRSRGAKDRDSRQADRPPRTRDSDTEETAPPPERRHARHRIPLREAELLSWRHASERAPEPPPWEE